MALPGHGLQALAVGAVRPPRHGRHPGRHGHRRRRRDRARARLAQGPGADLRLHAALCRRPTPSRAASRRWPRPGATSPPSAPIRIAITDNLNFGNPERPEIMGQIVRAIDGMAEACRALDFPVVSGNVSLYNETNGAAIPPTPTVGAVGLIADYAQRAGLRLDEGRRHPGADRRHRRRAGRRASICANCSAARRARRRRSIWPLERRNGDFVRALIRRGAGRPPCTTCPTAAWIAAAEMALAAGVGVSSSPTSRPRPRLPVRRGPGPLPDRHRRRLGDRGGRSSGGPQHRAGRAGGRDRLRLPRAI